ncbi:uncharacterized protein SPSK_10534 [Sporothrix schenckii 1099-18]|uniref:Uncharacterized protein n=1 Tax=Sporothrix schenckii 1099-18 TaxID=1397361 RepID=A0A0F2M2G2_SPOSC|nr:uncharacterized protein SPSK_10534 [Sporothrix schenckii 1099-18]KJR82326.1 hypothetical protein SPSK_10534 [Sporothrix schenckii 1099-18]
MHVRCGGVTLVLTRQTLHDRGGVTMTLERRQEAAESKLYGLEMGEMGRSRFTRDRYRGMQHALKRAVAVHSEGRPKRQLPSGRRRKRRINGRREEQKQGKSDEQGENGSGCIGGKCGNEQGTERARLLGGQGPTAFWVWAAGRGASRCLGGGPLRCNCAGLSVRRVKKVRRVGRKRDTKWKERFRLRYVDFFSPPQKPSLHNECTEYSRVLLRLHLKMDRPS